MNNKRGINREKKFVEKAVAFVIVILFVASAFLPVTGMQMGVKTINNPAPAPEEVNDQVSVTKLDPTTRDPPVPLNVNDSWWNPSWLYRKEITIDHSKVAATLTNFPVLISFSSDADLASKAQSDGDDIVFVDCYGKRLNHEIELYNSTTGKLVAWVNVSSLSSTANTVLYLYYGNPSCSNQQNPEGVWNSSFMMVQHLNETSGTCYDSTNHNNDGTPVGGLNQNAVGKIDGADSFNGVNSAYFVRDKGSLAGFTKGLTLSLWVKFNNITARQGILNKWASSGNARAYVFEYQVHASYGKVLLFSATDNAAASPQYYQYSAFAPTVGVWYHIAAVWTPGLHAQMYVNGVLATMKEQGSPISSIYNNTLDPLFIGSLINNSRVLNGSIDEARVTKIARSVGWLTTEYNNQNNPTTFYTIGNEESCLRTLTLTTSGTGSGTIQASPSGPYYYGENVTIWANASTGNTFAGFTGALAGTTTPQVLVMNGNKSVDAQFTLNGPYSLTLTTSGTGSGTIQASPSGPYYYGASVTIWANASVGSAFTGFTGSLTGTSTPQILTFDGSETVDAQFTLQNLLEINMLCCIIISDA